VKAISRCAILSAVAAAATVTTAQYKVTNLVSDGSIPAAHTDPNLVNAWGLAFSPTSFNWVANNHTGTSTLYDGNGVPQSLVVTIPGVGGTMGSPTGAVNYGGTGFMVGGTPSKFMFAAEDGSITGWSGGTTAAIAVDQSGGNSIFKGLALGLDSGADRLYATDFHNGAVNVFDNAFAPISGGFTDPNLPAGYAPFNAANINGNIYVTYALQDANGEDDVPGPGHGFINVFTTAGTFVSRLVSNGDLNSPWGMVVAPASFGAFGGDLLVGNFGDGHINAYDVNTGVFKGKLTDALNDPLTLEGLWALQFGNGAHDQSQNSLFFTAGPAGETEGLYGRIDMVPEPASLALLAAALLAQRRR
jgi:uncharacterized protein (TIGR03118 family)